MEKFTIWKRPVSTNHTISRSQRTKTTVWRWLLLRLLWCFLRCTSKNRRSWKNHTLCFGITSSNKVSLWIKKHRHKIKVGTRLLFALNTSSFLSSHIKFNMAGNSFGNIFSISTFGESHGKAIGVTIDGCPPNIEIDEEFIQS